MDSITTRDLVVLHLADAGPSGTDETARALGMGGTVSHRIDLLTTLSTLDSEGLAEVDGTDDRTVYSLTEDGRERAADVRASIDGTDVTVVGDERRAVPAADLPEHVETPTLAAALARVTDDGVLYREAGVDATGEGMVDREDERATIETALDAVEEGGCHPLLLTGDTGVGKSELLSATVETVRDRGWLVLADGGRGNAADAYHPVREALADAGVRDFEASVADDLEAGLARLRGLFDRRPDERSTRDGEAEDRRSRFFRDFADALRDLAATRPVALVVDDLQAADPATVGLLTHAIEALADAPVLIAGAYRTDATPDDDPITTDLRERVETGGTVLPVGPLDREGTRELTERELETRAVPESFVDRLYERTGGTPLFVIESLARCREAGVVDPVHDIFPDDATDLPVPGEARTAIEKRLSALNDEGHSLLELGGVVGERFEIELLAAASDLSGTTVREYVDALVEGGLWRRAGEDAQFASSLVREVVVEGIDPDRERRLHRRVAGAIESVYDPEDHHARIASHLAAAGDREGALERYRRAGDRARAIYAYEVAIDHYESALELARDLGDDEVVLDVLESLGTVRFETGALDEADRHFRYVRERTDDPERLRRALDYQSRIRTSRGPIEEGLDLAERGLDLGTPSTRTVARLHGNRGRALSELGRFDEALEAHRDQLLVADDLDDDRERAEALNRWGMTELRRGNYDEAKQRARQAIEYYDEDRDRRDLATCLNNLAAVHTKRGELEEARETFERILEIAIDLGDTSWEAIYRGNLGFVVMKLGEWDRALEYYETARDLADEIDADSTRVHALENAATIHVHRGDLETAREYLERARDLSETIDYPLGTGSSTIKLARVARLRDDLEAAREYAETGIDIAVGTDAEMEARAHTEMGHVLRVAGEREAAREEYRAGRDLASENGVSGAIARNAAGQALVRDETEAALEAATDAVSALADLGDDALPSIRMRALTALGAARRQAGVDDASEPLEEALDLAREYDATVRTVPPLLERGLLAHERGDEAAARDDLTTARSLAERAGATLLARQTRETLASITGD